MYKQAQGVGAQRHTHTHPLCTGLSMWGSRSCRLHPPSAKQARTLQSSRGGRQQPWWHVECCYCVSRLESSVSAALMHARGCWVHQSASEQCVNRGRGFPFGAEQQPSKQRRALGQGCSPPGLWGWLSSEAFVAWPKSAGNPIYYTRRTRGLCVCLGVCI